MTLYDEDFVEAITYGFCDFAGEGGQIGGWNYFLFNGTNIIYQGC